jgi:hypothetical protein
MRSALPLWSAQINIHNKSNRLDSRDEHRTQRIVLDQHAGFNCVLLSTHAVTLKGLLLRYDVGPLFFTSESSINLIPSRIGVTIPGAVEKD